MLDAGSLNSSGPSPPQHPFTRVQGVAVVVNTREGFKSADKAALLRRANLWKLPAAIQAALAQSQGLLLVTRNTKDFPASLDFVLTPYRIQPHRLA